MCCYIYIYIYIFTPNCCKLKVVWEIIPEQSMQQVFLWKDLVVLAVEFEIPFFFCFWDMRYFEIRKKYLQCLYPLQSCCKTWSNLSFLYHHNQIIAIRSLQSVPKLWHDKCCRMLSIANHSASTFKYKTVSFLLKFCVPISWIFPIILPNLTITTELCWGSPWTIHHTEIIQAYDLGFLTTMLQCVGWYHFICIKPGLTFTFHI